MGKHGPCYHCGVTSTPLWRNGPPEKPILCNACGSRWRTKGTLANYTPLHARAEHEEFEDYRVSKTISIKNKEPKVIKRKFDHNSNDITEFRGVPPDYSQGFHKGFDKDTSNGSSSGSAISNSESCVQYGSADASDLTGPSQPAVWDTMVPSKKRTCVTRSKPSSVEKLTKDLYNIWHEQWSSLSGSSEEELLLESGKPMVSVEIGHGSVLIRHPNSIAREEESEASSLSIDNKKHTVNSRHTTFPGLMEDTGVNSSSRGIEKIKKPANLGLGTEQERIKRGKDQLETIQILAHHNSPLCYIDLQDVLNMDKFLSHLTTEEQKQLLNFLSPVDTLQSRDSLKSMFDSPQFKENLLSFQKLLSEGVFDNSLSGLKIEDYRTLKKLILFNSTKSKWVERCQIFKDLKGKNCVEGSEVAGASSALPADYLACVKPTKDGQHQKLSGANTVMQSPLRITTKLSFDQKELTDNDGSFFSPRRLFSSPIDNSSLVLDSSRFADESSEQELLLDVPSSGSFPQAELLIPPSSFGAQASTSSSSVFSNLNRH